MRTRRSILLPTLLSLLACCGVLATFAAPKARPIRSDPGPRTSAVETAPAASLPVPAASLPATAPAASLPAPACGAPVSADPALGSTDLDATPVEENCSCFDDYDCQVCCIEEYQFFWCRGAKPKGHNPTPGVCFCWN